MSNENIFEAPKAELIDEGNTETVQFFPTSITKLTVLFISTFGVYAVYWFYKQWDSQKSQMDKKIIPFLRAIFSIFFTHSLFKRIEEAAEKRGITKSWKASSLATIYVSLVVVSNLSENISTKTEAVTALDYISLLLVFVMFIPLMRVQVIVNKINGDPEGRLNDTFSFFNIIFIFIGLVVWLLGVVGLFDPEWLVELMMAVSE